VAIIEPSWITPLVCTIPFEFPLLPLIATVLNVNISDYDVQRIICAWSFAQLFGYSLSYCSFI
jgi:hypothetical protein